MQYFVLGKYIKCLINVQHFGVWQIHKMLWLPCHTLWSIISFLWDIYSLCVLRDKLNLIDLRRTPSYACMYIPQIRSLSLFSPLHPHGTVPAPTGQRSERSNVIRRLTGVVLWVRHELTSPNWLAIAAAAFVPILFLDCPFFTN